MERPDVTRLYKYRAFDAYALISIINNVGWFATPESFNDPFDCAISIADEKLQDSVQHAIEVIVERTGADLSDEDRRVKPEDVDAFHRYQKQLQDTFSRDIGIFCLTEVPDDILMWAHYADCHRGFCIEYARTPHNTLGRLGRPVEYRHHYPLISVRDMAGPDKEDTTDALWLTKSDHWRHEKEWRILQVPGGKARQLDFEITGIVFGMRMSETERYTIRNVLANRPSVTFREAQKSPSEFKIEIVDARIGI